MKYSKKTCPKSDTWFVDGGRCGWGHECTECSEYVRPPLVQSYLCHTCGNVSDDIMDDNKCPMIDCGSADMEPITSEQAWEIERNREDEVYFPKPGEYVPING